MKKKVFLVIILIILFVFGILIYDFSDEMDSVLTNNKWYLSNNNEVHVLSLKNNQFLYTKEDGSYTNEYKKCTTFQYNSNISMIKLKCHDTSKKIYISNYDDNKLVLNEDGEEKTFYSSKELALVEKFKQDNNLSDKEYDKLLSINFKDDLFISYKKLMSLYKNKKSFYIGFVSNKISYENVYNYQVLNKLINNSSKKFYLIDYTELTEDELNKLTKLFNYKEDEIDIYDVKKKKIKIKLKIDINNKEEIKNYQKI